MQDPKLQYTAYIKYISPEDNSAKLEVQVSIPQALHLEDTKIQWIAIWVPVISDTAQFTSVVNTQRFIAGPGNTVVTESQITTSNSSQKYKQFIFNDIKHGKENLNERSITFSIKLENITVMQLLGANIYIQESYGLSNGNFQNSDVFLRSPDSRLIKPVINYFLAVDEKGNPKVTYENSQPSELIKLIWKGENIREYQLFVNGQNKVNSEEKLNTEISIDAGNFTKDSTIVLKGIGILEGEVYASITLGISPFMPVYYPAPNSDESKRMEDINNAMGMRGMALVDCGDLYMRSFFGITLDKYGGQSTTNAYSGNYAHKILPDPGSFAIRTRIPYAGDSKKYQFRTDFMVRQDGKVGIGTVNPTALLELANGTTTNDANLAFKLESNWANIISNNHIHLRAEQTSTINSKVSTNIQSDGIVNIHGPSIKLDTAEMNLGTSTYILGASQATINSGTVQFNTNQIFLKGIVKANDTILASSDINLKMNIEELSNILDKIQDMRSVSFVRKNDKNKKREIGVIAQEIEKQYPELVTTDDNGTKYVNYNGLAAVAIQAIKELKEEKDREIEELRKEVSELRDMILDFRK
jgi:hypothetical protein